MSIVAEKFKKFIEKLGGDEKKVQEALEQAELTEKDAEALGLTWKGDDPEPDVKPKGGDPESDRLDGHRPVDDGEETCRVWAPASQGLAGKSSKLDRRASVGSTATPRDRTTSC